jgi:hypothetical protein
MKEAPRRLARSKVGGAEKRQLLDVLDPMKSEIVGKA